MSIEIDITESVMKALEEKINDLSETLNRNRNTLPTEKKLTVHQVNMFETQLVDYLKRESSFIEHDVTFIKKNFWHGEYTPEIKVAIALNLHDIIRCDEEQLSQPIETDELTYIPTDKVRNSYVPGTAIVNKLYEYILIDTDERLRKFKMMAVR